MNRTRASRVLIGCGIACAVAVAACGRPMDNASMAAEASVTSAKVAAPTPGQEETASAGPSPADGEARAAGAPPAAETKPNLGAKPSSPAPALAKRKLDNAIRKEVNETAPKDEIASNPVTPPEEGGAEVTTTSAIVLRARPAPVARVAFVNRLPSSYQLERVRVIVDGGVSYDSRLPPAGVEMPAGDHVVEVVADYRLNDPVFTYLRGYHIAVRSNEVLPAARTPVTYVATARPKGGVTTPLDKAAGLDWSTVPAR